MHACTFRNWLIALTIGLSFTAWAQSIPVGQASVVGAAANTAPRRNDVLSFQPSYSTVLVSDTPKPLIKAIMEERDLIDIYNHLIRSSKPRRSPKLPRIGDVYFSVLPTADVSPSSNRSLVTATNAAFYLGDPAKTQLSSVNFSPSFNFSGQFSLPIRAILWSNNNRTNILEDWRLSVYPEFTYGLGAYSPDSAQIRLFSNYLRLYQTAFKRAYKSLYFGIGYHLDHHYNIREENVEPGVATPFRQYGYGTGSHSTSSGFSLNLLRDTRQNSINPLGGSYASFNYRFNLGLLGSDENWQSVTLDFRQYLKLRTDTRHILAIWTFVWSVVDGNPPYLDLPAIGWDAYGLTGRGYRSGRYRGKNMVYLETEYRFTISRSGLLGGVVFVNGHSVSEPIAERFARLLPGVGIGLRIKLNRKSRTNVTIDYGWGLTGPAGFYFGIGERF